MWNPAEPAPLFLAYLTEQGALQDHRVVAAVRIPDGLEAERRHPRTGYILLSIRPWVFEPQASVLGVYPHKRDCWVLWQSCVYFLALGAGNQSVFPWESGEWIALSQAVPGVRQE